MAMSKNCPLALFITGPIVGLFYLQSCWRTHQRIPWKCLSVFVLFNEAHISAHTQNLQKSFKSFAYRKNLGAHISAYLEMLVFVHAIPRGAHLGADQKLRIAALNIEFPMQLGTDTVSVGTDRRPKA